MDSDSKLKLTRGQRNAEFVAKGEARLIAVQSRTKLDRFTESNSLPFTPEVRATKSFHQAGSLGQSQGHERRKGNFGSSRTGGGMFVEAKGMDRVAFQVGPQCSSRGQNPNHDREVEQVAPR